jgi:hypothetical protein
MIRIRQAVAATLAAALWIVITSAAHAQDAFYTFLNGSNEVPPLTSTTAAGKAWTNLDLATGKLWYCVEANVAFPVSAAIHQAPAGITGPAIYTLNAVTANVWTGSTPAMTATQITDLYKGNLYINITSTLYPGGEIRGQLAKTSSRFSLCNLSGLNEVPPVPGGATGNARVILHEPEHKIQYVVTVSGLGGAATGGELRQAPAGSNGPLLYTLNGGATGPGTATYCGTINMSGSQANALLAGQFYVNIKTALWPAGEVRGQLQEQTESFVVRLDGAEVVPPTGSANTGIGNYKFSPTTGTIAYQESFSGALATGASVNTSAPGVNGPVLYPLAGPAAGPWAGSAGPLTTAQQADLFSVRHYSLINSLGSPAGEVRGQLRQNPNYFGYSGQTAAGTLGRKLTIGASGVAKLGGSWTTWLFDAQPGAAASLTYAEDIAGTPIDLMAFGFPRCSVLWVNPLAGYSAVADANGCAAQTFSVPAMASLVGEDFYFQWIAIDGGNVSWSDALCVTVEN